MNGFFTLVLQEVVMLQDIAQTVLCTLMVVNVVLLVLISIILLRNVSSVFPTCPHASECGKLLHSLTLPILKKVSSFYANVEKKMIALEDESVAKQNLELLEVGVSAHRAYEEQCSQGDAQDQIALLAGSRFANPTDRRQRPISAPTRNKLSIGDDEGPDFVGNKMPFKECDSGEVEDLAAILEEDQCELRQDLFAITVD